MEKVQDQAQTIEVFENDIQMYLTMFCEENGIDADFIEVDSLEKAKNLPCVFNNWAVFYGGRFVTVNQLDGAGVQKLLARG